jgi:hypothetical protein
MTEGKEGRWANRTTREALDQVLNDLPEGRLWEVLDFARYLRLNFPTNGGHSVKGVYSPLEVHHGSNATHLHS